MDVRNTWRSACPSFAVNENGREGSREHATVTIGR